MAVQTGYGKQQPDDPRATPMQVGFADVPEVYTNEPFTSYSSGSPAHRVLLTLSLEQSEEQLAVQHPKPRVDRRTRLLFRPEDARKLAQTLLFGADALDREADNETP